LTALVATSTAVAGVVNNYTDNSSLIYIALGDGGRAVTKFYKSVVSDKVPEESTAFLDIS